jgi:hypothetical protein
VGVEREEDDTKAGEESPEIAGERFPRGLYFMERVRSRKQFFLMILIANLETTDEQRKQRRRG